MTEDNGRLDLSRRKLLGSMATIGAAGAVGGAGSMAFFSDEESFANNQLTAGELDLKVDFEEHYSDWIGTEADPAADGSTEASYAEMADPQGDPDYLLPSFTIAQEQADRFVGDGGNDLGPIADGIDIEPLDGQPIALNFTGDDDPDTAQDLFWDATSIDAYPDADDDGQQDQTTDDEGNPMPAFPDGQDICDTDSDTQNIRDSDLRTESSQGEPLIQLDDVKPGDFGEVTFSLHLCDNPGFVWLTGGLVDADENGNTEPEAHDVDEFGPDGENYEGDPDPATDNLFPNEGDEADDPGSTDPDETEQERVELLDYVLTRIWRDDGQGQGAQAGNNQLDQITGELDVVCAIDTSGSLNDSEVAQLETGVNNFIDALDASPADARVGTLEFGSESGGPGILGVTGVTNVNTLSSPGPNVSLPGSTIGDAGTPMPAALDIADQLVNDTSAGARTGAAKAIVLFTDGGPNYSPDATYTAGGYSAGPFGAGTADSTVSEAEMEQTAAVAQGIRDGGTDIATVFVSDDDTQAMSSAAVGTYTDLPTFLASSGPVASTEANAFDVTIGNLGDLSDQLVSIVASAEDILFFGTLREALKEVSMGAGLALDGDTPAEEAGGAADARPCFSASSTNYIGFEWWLPIDHANQVQGDSAEFDLGFYTEQCRHNDGSGQVGNNA